MTLRHDEWDALGRKATDPARRDAQVLAYERAVSTSTAGVLPSPREASSRSGCSRRSPTSPTATRPRSAGSWAPPSRSSSPGSAEPRTGCASSSESDRTTVRTEPDRDRLGSLTEDEQLWLAQLLDRLPDELELEPTTTLIYGVPKLGRGLGLDDPPTDEVKGDQKAFFKLLYNLLVDADRGPPPADAVHGTGAGEGPDAPQVVASSPSRI